MIKMRICGQVSTTEEAEEIEFITKSFVVGNHARLLASRAKNRCNDNPNKFLFFFICDVYNSIL